MLLSDYSGNWGMNVNGGIFKHSRLDHLILSGCTLFNALEVSFKCLREPHIATELQIYSILGNNQRFGLNLCIPTHLLTVSLEDAFGQCNCFADSCDHDSCPL